jgi:hypothetical protein
VKDLWERQAGLELRALMRREGVSYADLAEKLALHGEHLTPASLTKKTYRGAFSFAFFLRCAAAVQKLAAERRGEAAPFVVIALSAPAMGKAADEKEYKGV